ncbi:hypothetical protein PGH12_05720 [Chryseobacterium wangxinyae]|uniref:hypothetical protein n=1 Tax=Chryseobacterium sp. CY350 TaxID=2997336 RepID=UPI00226F9BF6|nr:hypothetical protein [Chryseobacterium sp. CY350]MCY0976647.1 hypothetical protein [Chryseobacterium sp. CY350]WBZ96648.1 hypothetical protein PGH12_05720 [Chryseobacterium sp. CY350]
MKKFISILFLFLSITFSFAQNLPAKIYPKYDIANKNPLQTMLGVNEVFTAGDFPVTVLSAQGSNGIYSGIGYIVVPYLADNKVKVSFNNIMLNTDKKLIEGIIETTYDPNETAVNYASAGIGETFGDAGVKDVFVNFPIGNITYSATPPPGKITITGSDGNGGTGSTTEYPGGKDYTFTDPDGNIWTVDENGTVTQGGTVAQGGASTSTNTDGVTGSGSNATINQYTAKGIKIEWKENANGQFAYDTAEKTKLPKDKYPSVKDSENNTVYVPFKATVNKKTELFDAKVSITDPTLKDATIIFKTLSIGKAIEATESNKTDTERNYQLKLIGAFDYAEEEVIAVLMPKDSTSKQKVISSFRLVHLSPKTIDVSLVPLDASSQSKLQSQGDELNQIYKKIGVQFNVKKESVLDINSVVNGDTINSEDADLMSTYSPQQQQINALYKGTDARYVLFVTDKKSSTGQKGYMRLNGQFGYVYINAQDKTGAHELGHGVFKLEHPWKAYGTTQSATPLLMDYSTGEELSHLDWKQINNPAFKLYTFQGQSSGESVEGATFILDELSNFVTLDGKILQLPKGAKIHQFCINIDVKNNGQGDFPNGALYGFTENEKYYAPKYSFSSGGHIFEGYYLVVNNQYQNQKYEIGNQSKAKKDIVFLNYTAKASEPHFVNFIKIKSFDFIPITANKFVYTNYFSSFIPTDIVESIDFSASTCSDSGIPTKTKGKNKIKGDGRSLVDTVGGTKDGKDFKIKVYKNEKTGKYEVEVELTGAPKDSKVAEQKTAIEQQMKQLSEEKLNELGGLDGNESAEEKQQTEDGGEFWVRKMNGRGWLNTIGDLGESVWENAVMPESYWNKDKNYNYANIHIPPTFAGVGDGVIGEITDYPQLVKLGYDVATEAEVREGLWNSVKNINLKSIKTAATGAIKDKWNTYSNSPGHITYHEMGKDGVTVVSMAMGAGFFKKGADGLKDGLEETGEIISNKAAQSIAEFFDNISWKKGKSIWKKGKLSEHWNKHVIDRKEFGDITMDEYHTQMENFLKESSSQFKEVRIGNQVIKYDPNTSRMLVGHAKDKEVKSFYKALPEYTTKDPLTDAIDVALKETGLTKADVIYK